MLLAHDDEVIKNVLEPYSSFVTFLSVTDSDVLEVKNVDRAIFDEELLIEFTGIDVFMNVVFVVLELVVEILINVASGIFVLSLCVGLEFDSGNVD